MINRRVVIHRLHYDDEDDEFIQALYDSKIEVLTHKIHLTALAAD